jgi:hypothetical protein
LGAIEASADVTDATNVDAAGAVMLSDTTTSGMGFVIDEDAMGSDSATKVPTQQSVVAYVASKIASSVTLKGNYDASADSPSLDDGSPIAGIVAGDHYVVSVAGTFFTESLQAGDSIIAKQDSPTLIGHWITVNNNMITPVVNANIAAGIDSVKISSGVVSNTEFDYLNGVTSAIQTQVDSKSATAGNTSLVTTGTVTTGTWNGTAVASAYLDADTQHLSVAQTVTGKKTFGGAGAVGKLAVAGTTSGSTIIDATAEAGAGTVILPITGTLATLAGTETLTGKSIVATQLTGIIPDARMPNLTGAITTVEGAVATTLVANAVDSDNYVDASIDLEHLAADSVDGTKIADDAIDSEHYTDGSIDSAHLSSGLTIADPTLTFSINAQTGTTYTPVLADAGKIITLNNGSAIAVTIPPNSGVAFPVGSSLTFISIGAGLTTIGQGSGVTIASTGGTATAPIISAQHGSATAIKIATDSWQVIGAIE